MPDTDSKTLWTHCDSSEKEQKHLSYLLLKEIQQLLNNMFALFAPMREDMFRNWPNFTDHTQGPRHKEPYSPVHWYADLPVHAHMHKQKQAP